MIRSSRRLSLLMSCFLGRAILPCTGPCRSIAAQGNEEIHVHLPQHVLPDFTCCLREQRFKDTNSLGHLNAGQATLAMRSTPWSPSPPSFPRIRNRQGQIENPVSQDFLIGQNVRTRKAPSGTFLFLSPNHAALAALRSNSSAMMSLRTSLVPAPMDPTRAFRYALLTSVSHIKPLPP